MRKYSFKRTERISELLRRETSAILYKHFKESSSTLITITKVEISSDLHYAKIFVSIYNNSSSKKLFQRLNKISGFIRKELASRINLRFIPEIKFKLDNSSEYVMYLSNLLKNNG